jgi:hypothetical protein
MKFILFVLVLLATVCGKLHAAQKIALFSGDWNNPATWGGSVPASNDTLIIPAGITVNVNINTPTYTNMQINVFGMVTFDVGQKINMCPGGVYVAPAGSFGGGNPGSKLNICGNTVWNGPETINGPANLGGSTLPVELLAFVAVWQNNRVEISWTTASETNNAFFTLERSTNGLTFTEIARLNGAGTSSQPHSYSHNDLSAPAGTVYYRLQQTDNNGTSKTFRPVAVDVPATSDQSTQCVLHVYPNPCQEECTVTLTDCPEGEGLVRVELLDATGRQVSTILPADNNTTRLHVDTANNLKPGVYIVRGVSSKKNYQKKVVLK